MLGWVINKIWKEEKLPKQWGVELIVPIHKIGNRTDCDNYRWNYNQITWKDWRKKNKANNRREALGNTEIV